MTFGKTAKWMSALSLSLLLAACGGGGEDTGTEDTGTEDTGTEDTGTEDTGSEDTGSEDAGSEDASGDFDTASDIHVITREDGSGTRGAFVEIAGVVDENEDDMTTPTATVQNSTNGVMQAVAGDLYSIGYISLGSLDDSVKGVSIDGVEPTPENVQSGDYSVARNFNITWGQELSEVAQDFVDYINSAQAQEIVEEEGYVSASPDAPEYEASGVSGDITVVGSTSVEPLMQRFSEAYGELNPDVTIDITAPGSGAGITAAIDGSADIGMASRELDEEEASQVVETQPIAVDGIAVVVHNDNPTEDLALDDVSGIYLGDITTWDEVAQ